jgi:hypothetical protein
LLDAVVLTETEALADLAQRFVESGVLEACAIDDGLELPHDLANTSPHCCRCCCCCCYLKSIFEGLRDDQPLLAVEVRVIPARGLRTACMPMLVALATEIGQTQVPRAARVQGATGWGALQPVAQQLEVPDSRLPHEINHATRIVTCDGT